jgi:3-hydroxyisobutyrate dehydrogenase-like beta-hydroxyacid dehydrogenase
MESLAERGARMARSAKDVGDRVETVMASLPTPDSVLAVATGTGGVIEGGKVRRFVDLSTTGSQMACRVAEALAGRNIVQIDSPVSGGVPGAEKGTLAVMVSGPEVDIAVVKDALAVFGRVFEIGPRVGMAQTMKLANNFLSACALAATSEAVVMGVKAGLDPAVMVDVINAGSGRNTASTDKFPKAILPRTFNLGFSTALMTKDVRLCLAEAKALGVPMEMIGAVAQAWEQVYTENGPDSDFTTVVQPVERRAGVTVGGKARSGT